MVQDGAETVSPRKGFAMWDRRQSSVRRADAHHARRLLITALCCYLCCCAQGAEESEWQKRAKATVLVLLNEAVAARVREYVHPQGKGGEFNSVSVETDGTGVLVRMPVEWTGGILGTTYTTVVRWRLTEGSHLGSGIESDDAPLSTSNARKVRLDDYLRRKLLAKVRKAAAGRKMDDGEPESLWQKRARSVVRRALGDAVALRIRNYVHPQGKGGKVSNVAAEADGSGVSVTMSVDWTGGVLGTAYTTAVRWRFTEGSHLGSEIVSDDAPIGVSGTRKIRLDDYLRRELLVKVRQGIAGGGENAGRRESAWQRRTKAAVLRALDDAVAGSVRECLHPKGQGGEFNGVTVEPDGVGLFVRMPVEWTGGILGTAYTTVVRWRFTEGSHLASRIESDNVLIKPSETREVRLDDYFRKELSAKVRLAGRQ